ncbi:uncharacterized protein LOC121046176 [Ixodes scapularis]|uniref:uncharacterized protein LOC121046176 n=1 Tax=Ixodes scapularis TaxID=6945 RepID=UPI001A9F35F7|nr:uncharacterized protein LOC121046176 [Ixodes scapularis]
MEASEKNLRNYCFVGRLTDHARADMQDDSEVQESESILPDDGPGWGGSSDDSATPVNTIKTEPPDYVEQDEEPDTHLASVKSESERYEEDWKPNSRVPALTKDYTDMTQVTFHLNAEPQVSEATQRHDGAAVAVKIEPQDTTEVCTEEVPVGTDVRDGFATQQWGNVPANTGLGLDGSSSNSAMASVTIKTEPPEYVEQDEKPSSHLVSVTSETECYDEVWKPKNPVPALTKGEPPDYIDVTKVTFHANSEPQVFEEAQQHGNAAVAVKIEPQEPAEVDNQAIAAETGLGEAAPKEFQQDLVPVNPMGSYAVMAQPQQWVFPTISDKAQPQANIIYFHKVEQHGIAMQPVVTTLPVVAVQSVVAAESEQAVVVAVQPQQPVVAPAWLPRSDMGGESGAQQGLSVLLNAGPGPGAAPLRDVEQHRVHVDPTVPVQSPFHGPFAVSEGVQSQEDLVQFQEFKQS